MYIVYCHTNRVNDKRYVGWAIVKHGQAYHDAMMRRWHTHCCSRREDLFVRAIRKHGEGAFNHEVLEVMTTRAGIKHAEKLWIIERKSCAVDHPETGYNMTRGGDGGGMLGHVPTKEHREKIRQALRSWQPTPEQRLKMSVAKLGKPGCRKGTQHSIESISLQSKNARYAKLTEVQKLSIVARWTNRHVVRVTQRQLALDNDVTQSTVSRFLGGLTWK